MTDYRRFQYPGATWFFTVNLAERRGNRLLTDQIDPLRTAFAQVKSCHAFEIDAIVVLPEHLHCILTLPVGDSDFSTRWGLIKANFSRRVAKGERISKSREKRGERGVWQRRFWEHLIRDETDYRQHIDYIHWNPVKHGWVQVVKDWPYSSFHRYVKLGLYAENWGHEINLSKIAARE
ncbi:REP-associated tyrosine transposase [Methylomonas koyamae]|uniref:REP-associated tyrosine transposase n=1 Tax=Methylomonas koyamae TaxID=702114 RepID=UPI0011283980|nr:transposase [Methylomonas koyamae]TPQ25823.1 transposase [Methylomonas koyamae]